MQSLVKLNNSNVNFTDSQAKAIGGIIDFIAKEWDDNNNFKNIIGLIGPAGTGKTFCINYIIEHCKYSPSVIKCTSPTHKACRVFSESLKGKPVDTIHSTFGFALNLNLEDFDPDNPKFTPKNKIKLENIKVLIIDEASMIPVKLVDYIIKICKGLKIKIIYIGDSSQLPPPKENKSAMFLKGYNYELKEIVRQKKENPTSNLLKLLRDDITNNTNNFISYITSHVGYMSYNENEEGFCICNSREFKSMIDNCFSNPEYTKNIDMYKIIAYTNYAISNWNNYIRNTIIKDANKNILTKNDLIMSYQTIIDDFMNPIVNNSEEYIIHDIADYVEPKFGLKGFLVSFQLVHGGIITKPLFVLNHKDPFSVKFYYETLQKLKQDAINAHPNNKPKLWKEYYSFKEYILIMTNFLNKNGQITISRDLDYAFAITSHRSQGSTYDTVFVDLNDILFSSNGRMRLNFDEIRRLLYVACSRPRKQLYICYG